MIIIRLYSQIRDILIYLRQQRGETQVQLAANALIHERQLAKYERGVMVPGVRTLLRLVHGLGHHLVILPAPIAETMEERDAVVTMAAAWFTHKHDELSAGLLREAVERLLAAELRHSEAARTAGPRVKLTDI